jgi:hypothetical protein
MTAAQLTEETIAELTAPVLPRGEHKDSGGSYSNIVISSLYFLDLSAPVPAAGAVVVVAGVEALAAADLVVVVKDLALLVNASTAKVIF